MNTGKSSLVTSLSATFAGMSMNDIAQLIAFIVAIISGLMAIRYYWASTKLTQLEIQQKQREKNVYEHETKNHH